MNVKKEGKIILKQWSEIFIIVAAILGLIFSFWLITRSFITKSPKNELYNYNYNSNINYKVYLKQNDFFTEPFLGMDRQYVSSLIDHIDVDFKYNFRSSKDINYTYTYNIIAVAKAFNSESDGKVNEIWTKTYELIPAENQTNTGSNFNLNKTVSIKYDDFNKLLTDFKNKIGVTVNGRVDIFCNVSINGGLKDKENTLKENYSMSIQIPLLEQATKITPDYVNHGQKSIYNTKEDAKIDILSLIIGLLLLIGSIYLIKNYIKKFIVTTKKSEYIFKHNKILKSYGDVIAESKNLPDLSKYDVVNIKDFEDLVDIEEELHSPIICTEIRENLETWFMVLYDKTAYRYILKFEDFKK